MREAQFATHGNTIGSPALWLHDLKPAASNGSTFFLSTLRILNIKIRSIKLLAGERTPVKCLCFHGWTVLSNTLGMHYGGEGYVTDAKVREREKQTELTAHSTSLLKCLLYNSTSSKIMQYTSLKEILLSWIMQRGRCISCLKSRLDNFARDGKCTHPTLHSLWSLTVLRCKDNLSLNQKQTSARYLQALQWESVHVMVRVQINNSSAAALCIYVYPFLSCWLGSTSRSVGVPMYLHLCADTLDFKKMSDNRWTGKFLVHWRA